MGRKEKVSVDELEYGIKRINQWYKRKIKTLSIVTPPFNSTQVFTEIITDIISNRKQVLYTWGSDGENPELINKLKLTKNNLSYSNIQKGESNSSITFVNLKNIENISGKYELVIFDDISKFSTLTLNSLRKKYEIINELAERIIIYAIEPITQIGDKFELALINIEKPFVEPRFITTRIDLNKDIPYILYDYLKWFRDKRKSIIIYVPTKEKSEIIYNYYKNVLKIEWVKILYISKYDDKKNIKNVLKIKDRATFIITDFIGVNIEESRITNAIILFSSDEIYDYRKLIYICGQLGNINKELPEVIFVSRNISEEMEKAKEMARDFNKTLWEKRLKN